MKNVHPIFQEILKPFAPASDTEGKEEILIIEDLEDETPCFGGDLFEAISNLVIKQTKENYGIDLKDGRE